MADDGLSIGELGAAVGQSIADAQTGLTAGVEAAPRVMAIADATLELKVAASTPHGEGMRLHTIGPKELRAGSLNPAALSTVTFRFAALTTEVSPSDKPVVPDPRVTGPIAKGVIDKLNKKAEVKRLTRILGDVKFETFAAGPNRFRVDMLTGDGKRVREFIVKGDE